MTLFFGWAEMLLDHLGAKKDNDCLKLLISELFDFLTNVVVLIKGI